MIELIVGQKGKGKTKDLLDKVNGAIKTVDGNIAYLDKSTKHMFELNNRIRLINVSDYLIENGDEFLGFVSGILSQDHDLQQMYFDSFLKISHLEGKDLEPVLAKLSRMSEAFKVDFVLSISVDKEDVPAAYQDRIIIAL